jgi:hypothetical protein
VGVLLEGLVEMSRLPCALSGVDRWISDARR